MHKPVTLVVAGFLLSRALGIRTREGPMVSKARKRLCQHGSQGGPQGLRSGGPQRSGGPDPQLFQPEPRARRREDDGRFRPNAHRSLHPRRVPKEARQFMKNLTRLRHFPRKELIALLLFHESARPTEVRQESWSAEASIQRVTLLKEQRPADHTELIFAVHPPHRVDATRSEVQEAGIHQLDRRIRHLVV